MYQIMKHSVKLIVIYHTKTGENSLVLHCLTREWGRRSFIVSAGKRGLALYSPLNVLEAEVTENPKSDLWRAGACVAEYPLGGIRNNFQKTAISLFMSEVLFRTIRDNVREDGLFEWMERSILTLDAMEAGWSNFHLYWLLSLAGALGFSPSREDILPFAGRNIQAVDSLLTKPFIDCMMLPLNGTQRSEIAEDLLKYLSYHSDCNINLRSLGVLSELFK